MRASRDPPCGLLTDSAGKCNIFLSIPKQLKYSSVNCESTMWHSLSPQQVSIRKCLGRIVSHWEVMECCIWQTCCHQWWNNGQKYVKSLSAGHGEGAGWVLYDSESLNYSNREKLLIYPHKTFSTCEFCTLIITVDIPSQPCQFKNDFQNCHVGNRL